MLWLARDASSVNSTGAYVLSSRKPKVKAGFWSCANAVLQADIPASESPVKLKPGGGPVQVHLAAGPKPKQ